MQNWTNGSFKILPETAHQTGYDKRKIDSDERVGRNK
jgi:hypothetical protein